MRCEVTVLEYGLGNLFSIERAFLHLGADVVITDNPEKIKSATHLILPGVGAFEDGMRQLNQRNLLSAVLSYAQSGKPLMGICLGMQLLFSESEEFGLHKGLGIIQGRVVRMHDRDDQGNRVKIPYYGWDGLVRSSARMDWRPTILNGLRENDSVYFVHSYAATGVDENVSIAHVVYGGKKYCAAVQKGFVSGCQFHPEKSGEVGLKILRNFINQK